MSDEQQHPREAFADAAANGQIHPALVGYLAHLDQKLDQILNPPDPEPTETEDQGDKEPEQPARPAPTKATPSTISAKGGNR